MGMYGWAHAHRNEDESARRYAEQTELLQAQLSALAALPRKAWRKRRVLEYVCAGCEEIVLEVMRLNPYLTLRYRTTSEHPRAGRPGGTDPGDHFAHRERVGPPIRAGEHYQFRPMETPLPDPASRDNVLIHAACRCQSRELSEGVVIRDVRAGTAKRSLEASHRD